MVSTETIKVEFQLDTRVFNLRKIIGHPEIMEQWNAGIMRKGTN